MSFNLQDGQGHQALDANQHLEQLTGEGVISGVDPSVATGLDVQVTSGEVIVDGSSVSVSSQTVTLPSADSTDPRKDVITVDATGTLTVYQGTPESILPEGETGFNTQRPAPQDLSAVNEPVIAEVFVAAGATSLSSGDLRDRRVLTDVFVSSLTSFNDIDLNNNNLVSVNLVDGVDVSNHSSRHTSSGSDSLDAGDLGGGSGTNGQYLQTDGSAASWTTLEQESVTHISSGYITNGETTVLLDDVTPQSYSLETMSYTGTSFPIGVNSMVFSSDGTKMFTTSIISDQTTEYSLSTAYDISTATSTGVTINNPGGATRGLDFSSDGTIMVLMDTNNELIYEYSLSTAYDLSTASYTGTSLSTQSTSPNGVEFNDDGTKMFEASDNTIYGYSLSTAYDISTATSTGNTVSTQTDNTEGVSFSSDGTKMFTLSLFEYLIYEYSLSTAYDLSTASYTGTSLSTQTQPHDVEFNDDGTKMIEVSSDLNEYESNLYVTLSSADSTNGAITRVKDTTGSAGEDNVIITGESGETIEGQDQAILDSGYESLTFQSDGSDWYIISRMSGGEVN